MRRTLRSRTHRPYRLADLDRPSWQWSQRDWIIFRLSCRPTDRQLAQTTDVCNHCGRGRRWDIVGPDDVTIGVSYGDEVDAYEAATLLSAVYDKGRSRDWRESEARAALVKIGTMAQAACVSIDVATSR